MKQEQIAAAAIMANLIQQSQSNNYNAPWIDEFRNLTDTNIDGHVNILELAGAALGWKSWALMQVKPGGLPVYRLNLETQEIEEADY